MITIVTDSSAYLKKEDALALGVRVIPLVYTVNGRQLYEGFSDENDGFEDVLSAPGKYTTSQPNTAELLSRFEEERDCGNEILCVVMSSRLSGVYGAMQMAAQQLGNAQIKVFDSRLTAGGLYLLIKAARRLIGESITDDTKSVIGNNGIKLDELADRLTEIRDKIIVEFSVEDIMPLRNSGRFSLVRRGVGTILNTRPILKLSDGAVAFDSLARGKLNLLRKLTQKVPEGASEVVISYIGEHRTATELFHAIKEIRPNMELRLMKLGPVLGIHLGLKVLAISAITE